MRESDTYLASLGEGREAEAKSFMLRNRTRRFGPPAESGKAKLSAITGDLDRLERMMDRLADGTATRWQDVLDTP
jgi:hypothetical protein